MIHTDFGHLWVPWGQVPEIWGAPTFDLHPNIIHPSPRGLSVALSSHWNLAACDIIHRYCNLPYLHLWFSVKEGWAAGYWVLPKHSFLRCAHSDLEHKTGDLSHLNHSKWVQTPNLPNVLHASHPSQENDLHKDAVKETLNLIFSTRKPKYCKF